MTLEYASQRFGVPVALLRRLINAGVLPGYSIGGQVMVDWGDLADLVENDLRPASESPSFP